MSRAAAWIAPPAESRGAWELAATAALALEEARRSAHVARRADFADAVERSSSAPAAVPAPALPDEVVSGRPEARAVASVRQADTAVPAPVARPAAPDGPGAAVALPVVRHSARVGPQMARSDAPGPAAVRVERQEPASVGVARRAAVAARVARAVAELVVAVVPRAPAPVSAAVFSAPFPAAVAARGILPRRAHPAPRWPHRRSAAMRHSAPFRPSTVDKVLTQFSRPKAAAKNRNHFYAVAYEGGIEAFVIRRSDK